MDTNISLEHRQKTGVGRTYDAVRRYGPFSMALMSTRAAHLHDAGKCFPPRSVTSLAPLPFGTALARQLTAELDALLARFPTLEQETSEFTADESVQTVIDALRTATTDIRHARAALGWVATTDEQLQASAAVLGCSREEFERELKAPHVGLPLFIP